MTTSERTADDVRNDLIPMLNAGASAESMKPLFDELEQFKPDDFHDELAECGWANTDLRWDALILALRAIHEMTPEQMSGGFTLTLGDDD
jgi:hypothetical protein